MRTRTIARWRRAALGGALGASLAFSAGAQQAPAPAPQQPAAQEPPTQQQPAPADAQPAAQSPAAQPPAVGENPPVATEPAARPQADGSLQTAPGSPDEYIIQKGDTLWDLSQKFLSNPWYWPKIWSLNPGIENPHWIYPGNRLRLVPGQGGPQAPAQAQAEPPQQPVETTEPPRPPDDATGAVTAYAPTSPDVDVITSNSRESALSTSSVSVTGKLAFTPPPVVTFRTSGLLTPDELAASGSLDASFEERQMLSTYDTGYVRFKGEVPAKPGDKLVIFRGDGDVIHPKSNRKLASKTKNLGILKVLAIKGSLVTVQVEQVFEEIERGDRVRPWTPPTMRVAPRPNLQDVKGFVVMAVDNSQLTTFGEANTVFVDKGSADGVQEGNTFAVVRRGDGLNNQLVTGDSMTAGLAGDAALKVSTPDENVGLLLVLETKEHLSTAIVVKSIRELSPGDEVEMRATGAGGGGP